MLSLRVAAVLITGGLVSDAAAPLRVLRVTPLDAGPATSVITVTFDRPVAGSLERSLDPTSILSVSPAIDAIVDWRDPVTLRVRPRAPLPPGQRYVVTIRPTFTALDGSRLSDSYQFNFRVTGPKVIGSLPARADDRPRFLEANATFDLALSSAADAAVIAQLVTIELAKTCRQSGAVSLSVLSQRRIPADAPWQLREAGGWDRDRSLDSLRRLVTLRPAQPLPLGCAGELVVPTLIDRESPGTYQRLAFDTHGSLRLLRARCGSDGSCPTGPITLEFSTPVRGADVLRAVKVTPALTFTVSDTNDARPIWSLWADLKPRTAYTVTIAPTLTDQFGQRLGAAARATVASTGYAPNVSYASGKLTIERQGPRTLAVTHVNVDTLEVWSVPVPDSLEGKLLSRGWYSWREDWEALSKTATKRVYPVRAIRDRPGIFGVPFPEPVGPGPSLFAVRITSPTLTRNRKNEGDEGGGIALIQVTDLGIHAKIGPTEGAVWVTGVKDGKAKSGVEVRVRDENGRVLARATTDTRGIARLADIARQPKPAGDDEGGWNSFDGFVEARLGNDRAVVGVSDYDAELGLWQFNVTQAWGNDRLPAAAAVFTERGIYRPGDSVFAKVIVRAGPLGSLRAPAARDSVRVSFYDRDGGTVDERVVAPSAYGTAQRAVAVPANAPLGDYAVAVSLRRNGEWQELNRAMYRVAEYRPPEFLVSVAAPQAGDAVDGDSAAATISARYLFGAPMARAAVSWLVRQRPVSAWELELPNTDGFLFLERGWWWDEFEGRSGTAIATSKTDTLDQKGELVVRAPLALVRSGLPARATVEATVTDVNRQSVSGAASVLVHPASFYVGVKPRGAAYFWAAGTSQTLDVIAVRPNGDRVPGVNVAGVLVRREWHQVRRESGGYAQLVGEWVSDTVGRCSVRTEAAPTPCALVPDKPGTYTVVLSAQDTKGRPALTSFHRWVTGPGWVPWADESRFKMDVVPDRSRYAVGDTATVLFASPFTAAEAWVTVEREGIIEQRRITIANGATTIKFRVAESWVPNAFVSIVVARGRSAVPGPLDDPGRPTMRVGYAELRVTPDRKRLTVELATDKTEYRPRDTVAIRATVTDQGRGQRAEVTLWAVDEGVLSLTGYRTPDPVDLLYQPRGLGLRLGSNLSTVVPQIAQGDKGRNPGGGGGDGADEVLRSRFRTTAFFLGTVEADSNGVATTRVGLPDNLTTFRLMAVAVTRGDRYGGASRPLLVTRPIVARAALPRLVRPGDRLTAGVVVNQRAGGTPTVKVEAQATGVSLVGDARRTATLEAGRGREVRFEFTSPVGDSARFRFDVEGAGDKDAVRVAVPVREASRPRITTIAGTAVDTARASFALDGNTDPARSGLTISLGGSPAAVLRGFAGDLRVYPYYCSEQVTSALLPLIALYRVRGDASAGADSLRWRADIERGIAMLTRRQGENGAIGLWGRGDWSTPWLTTHAALALLDARDAGFAVADTVVAQITNYLNASLDRDQGEFLMASIPIGAVDAKLALGERVAVADFLSRVGKRSRPLENELVRRAGQLGAPDKARLALVLARGGDARGARTLLEPLWAQVKVEGRVATLPDSLGAGAYFTSSVAPMATLLRATLVVEPAHRALAPMLEGVIARGRTAAMVWWNTQDYGAAARAVYAWQERFPKQAAGAVTVRYKGRPVLTTRLGAKDSTVALGVLVGKKVPKQLDLTVDGPRGVPAFYYLTLSETGKDRPVRPEDHGMVVERWYEHPTTGRPVTEVTEGDLVRVRLRLTVPAMRSFVVLDDALPAGLEAIDLSLRTTGRPVGPGAADGAASAPDNENEARWTFGSWDGGWWSPFDHRELRDDRVVYSARALWAGSYSATYLARATTPGTFIKPPAHAEEMYNPAVYGRSDGGTFRVRAR